MNVYQDYSKYTHVTNSKPAALFEHMYIGM